MNESKIIVDKNLEKEIQTAIDESKNGEIKIIGKGTDSGCLVIRNGIVEEMSRAEAIKLLSEDNIKIKSFSRRAEGEDSTFMFKEWSDSAKKHYTNKTSEYKERAIAVVKDFEYYNNDEDINLKFSYQFLSEKTGEKLSDKIDVLMEGTKKQNLTAEFIKLWLMNAYTGVYCTPYEREDFFKLSCKIFEFPLKEDNYFCEECDEKFKTFDEFFNHLKVTNHKDDGIFKSYPYYEPLNNLKKEIYK